MKEKRQNEESEDESRRGSEKSLTQQEPADPAGVSRQTINAIEKGDL